MVLAELGCRCAAMVADGAANCVWVGGHKWYCADWNMPIFALAWHYLLAGSRNDSTKKCVLTLNGHPVRFTHQHLTSVDMSDFGVVFKCTGKAMIQILPPLGCGLGQKLCWYWALRNMLMWRSCWVPTITCYKPRELFLTPRVQQMHLLHFCLLWTVILGFWLVIWQRMGFLSPNVRCRTKNAVTNTCKMYLKFWRPLSYPECQTKTLTSNQTYVVN